MPEIIATFPTLVIEHHKEDVVINVASETAPKEVLRGHIGRTVVPSGNCIKKKTPDTLFANWKDGNLRVTHNTFGEHNHRYDFYWTSTRTTKLQDAFDLSGAHWYGGAQMRRMVWPLDKLKFKMAPFVAEDSYKDHEYGGVQERYWLSSNGVALFVHQAVPLFVGVNDSGDNLLRFQSKFDSPYRNNRHSPLTLRYSIFHGPNLKQTHQLVQSQKIDRPLGIPDESMFRLPIWSTWAICKVDVDQEKVISLAEQIKSYGIFTSQIQIDDDWAVHRGDWDFDRKKFPNPREMTRRLSEFGFNVTIWVHPFSNLRSKSIKKTDLFVKGAARGATKWWNGIGRVLDVTSPDAVEWYKKQLNHLRENYAIKSFKFDGGETCWLPKRWSMNRESNNPNMYTQQYAELAYEMDKDWRAQEVRVGVRSQKFPMFVRMMDKDSVWSEKNGLQSIIPTALLYGIIGYPFFIPDMIGGNAYEERPSKQLFIRWVQVCTFMPSMQFSIPPWWFDKQTVKITKMMLALRTKYADLIVKLAREAQTTGAPIIRPLWWVAPDDDYALKCEDEFLVGDDLLVAPVLVEDAKKRPVYLPAGQWRDERSGQVLDGGSWYLEYKVTIEDLPYFTRVTSDDAKDSIPPVVAAPIIPAPEIKSDDWDSSSSSSSDSSDDESGSEKDKRESEAAESDLIVWDEGAKTDNAEPVSEEIPVEPAEKVAEEAEELHDLLETDVSEQNLDETSVLQPQPSVDEPEPVTEEQQPNEPPPDVSEFDQFAELRASAPVVSSEDSSSDSSEDEKKEDSPSDDEPKLRIPKSGGNLLRLLRKSIGKEGDVELPDAFASLVRGKYRFSHLDEEFNEKDFMADLSDSASLDEYGDGGDRNEDTKEAPLAASESSSSSSESEAEEDVPPPEEPEKTEDITESFEKQLSVSEPEPSPELDSPVPGEDSQEQPTPELDSPVPAEESSSELDSPVLADDSQEKSGSSLYQNVNVPPQSEKEKTPPATKPKLKIPKRRPPPPEPAPGGLTLWDELCNKLKGRPKFDPELDGEVPGLRSMAIQTSFDVGDRDRSSSSSSSSSDSSV